MNNGKILLIAQKFDTATNHSFECAKKVKADYRLLKNDATRKNFEKYAPYYDIIIIFSHGNIDKIAGQNKEIMIDQSNVHLLKDKKVFAMTCLSAKKLGEFSDAEIFLGFDETFIYIIPYANIYGAYVISLANNFYKTDFNQCNIIHVAWQDIQNTSKLAKIVMKRNLNHTKKIITKNLVKLILFVKNFNL